MFFRRSFERLAILITTEIRTMSTALDAIAAKITNLEAKADATVAVQAEVATELKSLRSALDAALASDDTAALAALGDRIDAVASKLDTSSTALAAVEVPAAAPVASDPPVTP